MSGRLVLAIGLVAVGLLGSVAGAAGPPSGPQLGAEAWAVRIVVPSRTGAGTETVAVPPAAAPVTENGFAYPASGTIVSAISTSASSRTGSASRRSATATSSATGVILFGGEITVDSVSARAEVVFEDGKYQDSFVGTGLTNLQVLGEEPSSRQVALEDWGSLVVDERSVERSGPRGARVYKGSVNALAVRLTAAHGGLPAGSEILIGHAGTSGEPASEAEPPAEGDEPAAQPPVPFIPIPDSLLPTLGGGPYLFPVFGDVSYGDTYGDPRPDVTYHHGNDIFGELGQPLVAVADGTVFAVGWNKVGGNRLWLRDHEGNVFYYAHLSAFSALVTNGARVRAGQVVGFMGHTGDAEAAPPHLHFEVHPVSLLYLGYDGAVDPSAYIDDWRRLERLPFPVPAGWAPNVPGASDAPQPGAVLLGVSDISSAAGLDPDSLRRALESRPRP